MNPAQKLIEHGQSVWYDNISRELLKSGELQRLVKEWGVRGITSNPAIFEAALSKGSDYDEQINSLKGTAGDTASKFEELAVTDIAKAADLLLPIYEESGGTDGFVSIEVSPRLARDTEGTIEEAKRLHGRLNRPNVMIKIPGTKEGIPAIQECLEAGISINITLLFSAENYVEVANTYCKALRARVAKGEPVDKIRSVASFFVSRVDVLVDSKLNEIVEAGGENAEKAKKLLGEFGIANSKVAYQRYVELFESEAFADLKAAGAAVQRPLWASTGVKNPELKDTTYVEALIGPETVNTLPHATLEAFADHGEAARTIDAGVAEAMEVEAKLKEIGVDVPACLEQLQQEGVDKFVKAFDSLNAALEAKLSS